MRLGRGRAAALGVVALGWLSPSLAGLRAESVNVPTPVVVPDVTVKAPPPLMDPEDRMGTGHLKPGAEDLSRANALYAEALGNDPDANPQETLGLLRQVVELDPAFADAQVRMANLLLQSGQLESALAHLQAAAKINPDSVAIEAALGYTQRLRGENEEAIRYSTAALNRDASQSSAMRVLLEIAGDQHDLAGGVIHVEDILRAGGEKVGGAAWLTLARLYVEVARGDVHPPSGEVMLKTLLPIYQEAAAKTPPDVETLTLLADTYRDLGRKLDGLKTLREAMALDPSDVDLILRCADLESELGEKAAGLADYETAYRLNPGMTGLRETLARLYLDHQRYADAARLLEEALTDAPRDPGLEIDLGIAYEGDHHPDQAEACFERVFSMMSCPPEAYLRLAAFQLANDEVRQASGTLAAAAKRFPNSARVRFYQAIELRYEKNYIAALNCLDEVRGLATGGEAGVLDSDYYLESSMTLNLAGFKDRLETVLHEGLTKFPDSPELMNELAYFWADQGVHLPEALTLSRRAAELAPDNGPILDTRGWVYYQMGQAKDALPYLQRAAVMTNNDPVVLQHVGDAYLKLGLRREAIATWRRALEKDPRNGDLVTRIDAALAQAKNAHLRSAPTP